MARLGDVMLRGDSLGEILTDPRAGKRNAFLAMLTSALVPGLVTMRYTRLVVGGGDGVSAARATHASAPCCWGCVHARWPLMPGRWWQQYWCCHQEPGVHRQAGATRWRACCARWR